ncbi:GH25 family lysozyme [Clostridium sardiniense]
MLKGIDISMHNGTVNFNKVKQGGIDVVIIKATEGVEYIDPLFQEHYNGVKNIGLGIGFYHFMSEKTSPTQQAIDFWNAIKDKKFNVLPSLDIETNKLGRSRTQISDRCVEFLKKFKELSNVDCMIYTGGYFGRDNLDSRVKKYPGWIAHYGVTKPMENGFKVIGHQYTEDGVTEGVKGKVDLNNFTEEIFINSVTKPVQKPSTSNKKELWELSISGEEVRELQTELNRQFDSGLKVDGYFGESTLNACITVGEGARGNITRLIQQRLLNRGYTSLNNHGGADGSFGLGTTQAIKNLQRNKGLSVDGIVGKNTWKALYSK